MRKLEDLTSDPRVTRRWCRRHTLEQKAASCTGCSGQRALDNPALDVAVEAANALKQPVVIFFAPLLFYPHANLRHYAFLTQGIPDTAERARDRGIGFVLRRYPDIRW